MKGLVHCSEFKSASYSDSSNSRVSRTLTVMLLFKGKKGGSPHSNSILTVLIYLHCLPIFPTDTGTTKHIHSSLQARPG